MAWDLAVAISPVMVVCNVKSADVANDSASVIASDFLVSAYVSAFVNALPETKSAYVSDVEIAAFLAVNIAEFLFVTSVLIAEDNSVSVYDSAVAIAFVTAV